VNLRLYLAAQFQYINLAHQDREQLAQTRLGAGGFQKVLLLRNRDRQVQADGIGEHRRPGDAGGYVLELIGQIGREGNDLLEGFPYIAPEGFHFDVLVLGPILDIRELLYPRPQVRLCLNALHNPDSPQSLHDHTLMLGQPDHRVNRRRHSDVVDIRHLRSFDIGILQRGETDYPRVAHHRVINELH
jgi:hypothetical protein